MKHRHDEATLLAFLDGELDSGSATEVERALAEDADLSAALDALRRDAECVSAALAALDTHGPTPVTGVPLQLRRAERRRRSDAVRSLRRAAILILGVGAVTASALPGSPVPGWIRASWERLIGLEPLPTPSEETVQAPAAALESGVRTPHDLGRLVVALTSVSEGTALIVRFGTYETAGVFAAGDPRFATEAGRIEVDGPGPSITLEVPAAVTALEVTVDGRLLLRRSASGLETRVTPLVQTDERIEFRLGGA